MKSLFTTPLLIFATETAAFTATDHVCEAVAGYHQLKHAAAAVSFCRPEMSKERDLLADTSAWLKVYLLEIRPDKETRLEAYKETFGFPNPRDCQAVEEYGGLDWIGNWEALASSIDEFKHELRKINDTRTKDWTRCL